MKAIWGPSAGGLSGWFILCPKAIRQNGVSFFSTIGSVVVRGLRSQDAGSGSPKSLALDGQGK